MTAARLRVEVRDNIGRLTLARPDGANAIDLAFAREFRAAADTFVESRVRAVLITGEGRHFCAGGDVKAFSTEPDLPTHLELVTEHLHAGIATLVEMDAPVVCAVQGSAAGAGVGLVGAADIAIAGAAAKFVMAYTSIGLSPDGSSSWFLPRHVGLRRALDLTLTNRVLSAPEALEWGLVSRVVPDDDLAGEAEAIVSALASGPTVAYGAAARLLRASATSSLRDHLANEAASIAERARSRDGQEGIASFIEKRPGSFTGQ
jgi:2-(1,2-epoxy-1,2-dihydrophenyl)acetyl-CoA isomerase